VYSSVSYSLGSNVENLYVYGTAYSGYGNSLDNTIYGNSSSNYIDGGAGNDYIDGGAGNDYIDGGTGNDAMYGGTGNDIYWVDSSYDTVSEYVGEGTSDWVYSSVSYSLGSNVENLYVMGTAYSGYGNSLDNVIYGNSSSNYLDAGTGNDAMYGGYGNDIVVGGYGNDTVNGYGGGSTEVDYLYGRTGGYNYGYADADTYVLGDAYGAYYNGASSYAIVTDYTYSEGDKIQLYGSSSNYYLGYGNYGGTSATDTYLYSYSASAGYDLVGIVQDATTLNISYV
jgi:Ca2+-binding RTX toxin-like protein